MANRSDTTGEAAVPTEVSNVRQLRASAGQTPPGSGQTPPVSGHGDCALLADLLAVYADGGLGGEEARRFDRHLAECVACTMEVAEFREVLSALRADPLADGTVAFARPEAAIPHHGEAFWRTLAADIDTATRTANGPLRHDASDDSWTEVTHIETMRRRRWWQVSAIAGGAIAAAAAVLLMVAPLPNRSSPEATLAALPERTANWFEVPALQLDEDLGTSDGDPLETLDGLDDNELELVDSELGDGV